MTDLDTSAAAGTCIAGRYDVETELGRGGMGAVYRVRDRRNGQRYALKRGWAKDARKAQRRSMMLEREYHTLTQLAHPRIIEVYEYGIDDAGPYYTMELLAGNDLDKSGRVSWQQACALLHDVASSLAILHARGLLHRDVSLRNVRCTPEGRAKLIDFGAMSAIGTAKDVVGTPPFVPPEVLQMQELDARSDLFSLGAVGYHLLTGRNAYPARSLSDLRDMWRSRPVAPARLVPEIPSAVSELITQLLMLDRNARPASAAEVMERLCALAGLPMQEHIEVSRAYLTTPALVGRGRELVLARKQILSLVRRDGGTLLIDGVAGSGRSRMLDACVLEGKLLGITVVRANAGDAAQGDWGVTRALCRQLAQLMPNETAEATRLSRDVLAHVLDGLASEGSVTSMQPDRSLLLRELRDFVLSLSRAQRLMLVVDDVDAIDEPSAALLATLAHKTERHALMLTLAIERDLGPSASASLRLLRLVAKTIELELLQPDETEMLLRSIFGDAPNLQLVAARIHALAHGSPRATLDLAQHLVERGFARYQAGSWLLPAQIDESDLPNTLAAALGARIDALETDARVLAEVQAVADGDALDLDDLSELSCLPDHKRVFSALDELVAGRVLLADGAGYRFTQRGFVTLLQASIPADQRRAIHARMADLLGRCGGDVRRRAHHLLSAGREREAVDLLCSVNLHAQRPSVSLFEQAIEQAERHAFPARVLHQLRAALLGKASLVPAPESFRKCLPKVLAQLESDSALARYRELETSGQSERLQRAVAETHARYLATPEAERVHGVVDAIGELARITGAACTFATQLFDLELLESLPPLEPLVPLSPGLAVVQEIIEVCKLYVQGRYTEHRQRCDSVLERIEEPGRAGLDEIQQGRVRAGLHNGVGLFEASLGISTVEARAQILEGERGNRANAWRMRMVLHLNQGNVEEARKCERRAELFQLQESGEQSYLGMSTGFEVMALAEVGDLVGVKSCLNKLTLLAERLPAWRGWAACGLCRYRWLQGDLPGALEALAPGFEVAAPMRHPVFGYLVGLRVRLLAELGRSEEALACGREYLELYRSDPLMRSDQGVVIGLAQAFAAAGRFQEALDTLVPFIESSEKLGCEGLALGILYEMRAHIAIRAGDRVSLDRAAELCAREYSKANNPALIAKFARLLEDARQRELGEIEPTPEIRKLLDAAAPESEYNTVHSRILECVDNDDRARCALTLLLQSTGIGTGYLYGVRDDRAVLLAALPELPADAELARWVDDCLQSELESSENATATADGGTESQDERRTEAARAYFDGEGRCFEPILLLATKQSVAQVAAILLLHVPAGPRALPPRALLEELAQQLLDHGDVNGMRVEEAATR